jgi:hypothetical protein
MGVASMGPKGISLRFGPCKKTSESLGKQKKGIIPLFLSVLLVCRNGLSVSV